ncbi:MAG: multicopper oxidase domain-containing protein [Roseiflexaceae bacterium]|nr:multicopper oxidase domain-containing protein [Roseiflexaceae bacterium]
MPISRRNFLKLAGGTAVTVTGASLMPQFLRKTLMPEQVVGAATPYDLYFAGTDGWFSLPAGASVSSIYHPDPLAPAPFNTYIFGFRNVTHLDDTQRQNQRNKAQHNAPFFWADEGADFRVQLTNLGLALRPDLTDAHTLHWHGFRNVIPYYDGEPTGSISVLVNTTFTYVYKPHDPGTYMYHCHVEDIEHVTMGMTGIVFVRAAQNKTGNGAGAPIARQGGIAASPVLGYAYNDGVAISDPRSTAFDREFPMFLSEIWLEGHWNDAHIQESQWYNFKADFSLLNGRVYPDTLAPNAPIDLANSKYAYPNPGKALTIQTDANGDLLAPAGRPDLQYQPHSALVTCNAGERVLLRFANLGFREASMTLAGIPMKVVGRDATPMKGRDGTDTSYVTDTLLMGAGESYDVIFTAPAFSGGSGSSGGGYDVYVLYNRRYTQDDDTADGTQGQRTEVRVYPGTLSAQQYVNDAAS